MTYQSYHYNQGQQHQPSHPPPIGFNIATSPPLTYLPMEQPRAPQPHGFNDQPEHFTQSPAFLPQPQQQHGGFTPPTPNIQVRKPQVPEEETTVIIKDYRVQQPKKEKHRKRNPHTYGNKHHHCQTPTVIQQPTVALPVYQPVVVPPLPPPPPPLFFPSNYYSRGYYYW